MWPSLGPDGGCLGRQDSPRPNQLQGQRQRPQNQAELGKMA